jgi:hypothetical protein
LFREKRELQALQLEDLPNLLRQGQGDSLRPEGRFAGA